VNSISSFLFIIRINKSLANLFATDIQFLLRMSF